MSSPPAGSRQVAHCPDERGGAISCEALTLLLYLELGAPTLEQIGRRLGKHRSTVGGYRERLKEDRLLDGPPGTQYGQRVTAKGLQWLRRLGLLDIP